MELLNRIYTLGQLSDLARALHHCMGHYRILTFEGDLGAGKTTLIRALCQELGVQDTVGSPTFALVNEYIVTENGENAVVYHMDLYRISGEEEAEQAGIEDLLFSGRLCLVEWPQRAPGIFPKEHLSVILSSVDHAHRRIAVISPEN